MSTILLILYVAKEVLSILSLVVLLFLSVYLICIAIGEKKRVKSLEESIEILARFQNKSESRIGILEAEMKNLKNEKPPDCLSKTEI